MHHLLRKQRWIMIFISLLMGWSGIVLAQAKPMHALMSLSVHVSHPIQANEYALVAYNPSAINASIQNDSSEKTLDCHEQPEQHPVMQHNHTQDLQQHQLESSQSNLTCSDIEKSNVQVKCIDCILFSCQPLTALFDFESIQWVHTQFQKESETQYFLYSAQHLTGYWQEILRPPKA